MFTIDKYHWQIQFTNTVYILKYRLYTHLQIDYSHLRDSACHCRAQRGPWYYRSRSPSGIPCKSTGRVRPDRSPPGSGSGCPSPRGNSDLCICVCVMKLCYGVIYLDKLVKSKQGYMSNTCGLNQADILQKLIPIIRNKSIFCTKKGNYLFY